jgi:hypothetical protein
MRAQRSGIYVQEVHASRLAHAAMYAFPAHASLISAHASLISTNTSSMVSIFWHDDVALQKHILTGTIPCKTIILCKLGSEGMPTMYYDIVV